MSLSDKTIKKAIDVDNDPNWIAFTEEIGLKRLQMKGIVFGCHIHLLKAAFLSGRQSGLDLTSDVIKEFMEKHFNEPEKDSNPKILG